MAPDRRTEGRTDVRKTQNYISLTSEGDNYQVGKYLTHFIKTCVKRPLSKRPKIGFQDQISLNACQKNCRMLQGEHSAILSTFIRLPFVIKVFVLSILSGCFTQVLLY